MSSRDLHLELNNAINAHKEGNFTRAVKDYFNLLRNSSDPSITKVALNNLAIILKSRSKPLIAIGLFRKALEIDNEYADALYNYANCLHSIQKYDDSILIYSRLLKVRPNHLNGILNLGNSFKEKGKYNEAKKCYSYAINIDSTSSDAKINLALILLAEENYEKGFELYEERTIKYKLLDKYALQKFDLHSDVNKYKNIFVLHEQGFGDTIMFSRYLPALANYFEKIYVLVQEELTELMEEILETYKKIVIIKVGDKLPEVDMQIAMLSLPIIYYKLTKMWIAPQLNYIRRGMENNYLKKVGIIWRGSKTHKDDFKRSLKLDKMYELVKNLNAEIYSLQYEPSEHEVNFMYLKNINIVTIYNFKSLKNEILKMDAVISVDTSAAHLAGTLGIPTVVLISNVPDWRWGISGQTTKWYKNMVLSRADQQGNYRINVLLH